MLIFPRKFLEYKNAKELRVQAQLLGPSVTI